MQADEWVSDVCGFVKKVKFLPSTWAFTIHRLVYICPCTITYVVLQPKEPPFVLKPSIKILRSSERASHKLSICAGTWLNINFPNLRDYRCWEVIYLTNLRKPFENYCHISYLLLLNLVVGVANREPMVSRFILTVVRSHRARRWAFTNWTPLCIRLLCEKVFRPVL